MYTESMHPFVGAMVRALVEPGSAPAAAVAEPADAQGRHQYDEDKRLMYEIADQLISERRRQPLPEGQQDILDTMLIATDPKTGERLSDENARYQLVTFLIAGHETTSGLLTFTLYQLLRHPQILARAQHFVDEVLGHRAPAFEDLAQLGYLDQILKESLRLWRPRRRTPCAAGTTRRSSAAATGSAATRLPSCSSAAAPRSRGLGRAARGVRSRPVRLRTGRAAAAELVEAVRQTASAPASGAGSRCRRPPSSWP